MALIWQYFINALIAASIYSLIALGFTLIYRTVHFFHLAHGGVYTIGAYLTYTFFKVFNSMIGVPVIPSFVISLVLSMIISGILGVLIDRMVYYPLRRKFASDLIFLLASFGVFVFIQNLVQIIYGAHIYAFRIWSIREGYKILGAVITNVQILIIISSIFIMFVLWLFLQKTKFGKAIRAVADDPVSASVIGINAEKIITIVFFIGSALAGFAGTLISLETNLEPTMGFTAILKGIIAAIVGGIGSLPGAILGGTLLGFAENLAILKIQAGWKDTIAFGILVLFLLFKPEGILGIGNKREDE